MLTIPQDIFEQMLQQAKAEAPIEACGILAGKEQVVEKFYKMTNADSSNDHFMMIPQEQFAVMKNLRTNGLEMLAIYHSHPETPARPSQEDIRLALTLDMVHVILSLEDADKPYVKGFLIEDSNVTSVPIDIKKLSQ